MFGVAVAWLIQHKVLLPGESTLSRLVSEIRQRAADRLWQKLSSLPNNRIRNICGVQIVSRLILQIYSIRITM